MVTAVRISTALLGRIRADALAEPGRERCGLLFGAGGRITAFEPVANVAAAPATRFELDPARLIAAHRRARAGGEAIVGHYHSHPSGGPSPSPADAGEAAPDGQLWLIVAAEGEGLFRAVAGGPPHGMFEAVAIDAD